MDTKLHPAVTVSSVTNIIPIKLEMDTGHWPSWSELFKTTCKAYQVHDHLLPRPPPATPAAADKDKQSDADAAWERLDSIVLQWIYGTISQDLIHTIVEPDKNRTAHQAWTTLENLFQDNKSARALHLRHRFTNTRLENFQSIFAYCQELKTLSDQLASVGHPVDNDGLVLQLIAGLTEQYESIGTLLQAREPLPPFYTARSKLCMVESRKAENTLHASKTASTALNTSTRSTSSQQVTEPTYDRSRGRGRNQWGRGQPSYNSWSNPFPPY
ncbi:uncharacterized protein LOC110932742 [Helianthus annuus]|uniref:uncharacterized protein LOC110932742 n=1 Tax=Helianthus annuus TaxID=4232 RepID=UPI000B8F0E21|nr:uncharacterized protein LOC110932742 [Helianthus annuus]